MPSDSGTGRAPVPPAGFVAIGAPPGAPPPVGPYSPGILAGGWLYLSGQIALLDNGTIASGGVREEAGLIFSRLGEMLARAGVGPSHVVKVTLYLTDMGTFQMVNEACANFFSPPYPARVTVGVKDLPKGANLEVDVVAYVGETRR